MGGSVGLTIRVIRKVNNKEKQPTQNVKNNN